MKNFKGPRRLDSGAPRPNPSKRPRDGDLNGNEAKKPRDEQYDDGLRVIDKYTDPCAPKYPSKRPRDGDLNSNEAKKPRDDQYDDGLSVIDEYNDPGEKPSDYNVKPIPNYDQDDDELKVIDEYKTDDEHDDQFTVIDSYDEDGQSDDNLTVIDQFDDHSKTKQDYKKKYLDCLKAHKSLRAKFLAKTARANSNHKASLERAERQVRKKFQEKIAELKKFHERQMQDLEKLMSGKCDDEIQEINKRHDKIVAAQRKELEDYEKECERKLKLLNDQIMAMQKDDEDLSSLSKAIFNCTTMEEIFEIQKLVNNHQLDEVVKNHLPTLQNLFLSLSYGILPICQPQRDQVTDDQRQLVEKIQTGSPQAVKRILKEKRADIINLFTIIKKSIKLARDTYNQYGIF